MVIHIFDLHIQYRIVLKLKFIFHVCFFCLFVCFFVVVFFFFCFVIVMYDLVHDVETVFPLH